MNFCLCRISLLFIHLLRQTDKGPLTFCSFTAAVDLDKYSVAFVSHKLSIFISLNTYCILTPTVLCVISPFEVCAQWIQFNAGKKCPFKRCGSCTLARLQAWWRQCRAAYCRSVGGFCFLQMKMVLSPELWQLRPAESAHLVFIPTFFLSLTQMYFIFSTSQNRAGETSYVPQINLSNGW